MREGQKSLSPLPSLRKIRLDVSRVFCFDQRTHANVLFVEIINGQRNRINLLVENQSEQNVTLLNIGGAFHDPNTNRLIQNVCRPTFLSFSFGSVIYVVRNRLRL